MSTNCQFSSCGTVNRKQRHGSSLEVPCPASIISYNKFISGVDRGDQLRGYYHSRSKSRKFYKYIFLSLRCDNNQCLHPPQVLWFLPFQGLKIVLTPTCKRSDWGVLQSLMQRSWWHRHPPSSIPALPHQARQWAWWISTPRGSMCSQPRLPPSLCPYHMVLAWAWWVTVPYRRCKWLFYEMAHTTTCITLDSHSCMLFYFYVLYSCL